MASQGPGLALSTPVPPLNWPISPGGAGSPGPTLGFALMFLPPPPPAGGGGETNFSCLRSLVRPLIPIFKAIEKVYAIKAVASFLSDRRPFCIRQPVGGIQF